jgi:hypothetical protein
VLEGKVVYLGEFRLTVQTTCQFELAVTDRWLTQDREIFAKRMASIDPERVENQTSPF